MKRTLIIMRHSRARKDEPVGDFQRSLSPRGVHDAEAVGEALVDFGFIPESIVCSAAIRCEETAEAIANIVGVSEDDIQSREELYLASSDSLLSKIRKTPEKVQSLMVIAHSPGVYDLSLRLGYDDEGFPTSSACVFQFSGEWKDIPAGVRFVEYISPDMIME